MRCHGDRARQAMPVSVRIWRRAVEAQEATLVLVRGKVKRELGLESVWERNLEVD